MNNRTLRKRKLSLLKTKILCNHLYCFQGAQFSQSDYDGRTALHVACSEGKTNIVRFLLGNGALVHQRDRYGHTPLDDAVRFNHHDVISVLRQVGAHLNVPPFKLGTMLCK